MMSKKLESRFFEDGISWKENSRVNLRSDWVGALTHGLYMTRGFVVPYTGEVHYNEKGEPRGENNEILEERKPNILQKLVHRLLG